MVGPEDRVTRAPPCGRVPLSHAAPVGRRELTVEAWFGDSLEEQTVFDLTEGGGR